MNGDRAKRAGLLARLWRRIARPAVQKPLPADLFVPVIFANKRDDDTAGLRAFFENRTVIIKGQLFEPCQEGERVLFGLDLRSYATCLVFTSEGRVQNMFGFPGRMEVFETPPNRRFLVKSCHFHLGLEVLP